MVKARNKRKSDSGLIEYQLMCEVGSDLPK